MNHAQSTTREVARELTAAEDAVEAALAQSVRLMRCIMEARRALGLPSGADAPPMQMAVAAVSALGEAQQAMIRTHRALHEAQRRHGLPPVAFGPLLKPGEDAGNAERRVG